MVKNSNKNGVNIKNCTNITINNNYIINSRVIGINATNMNESTISNNTVNGSGNYGFYLFESNNVTIHSNTVQSALNYSIGLFNNSNSNIIYNNYFDSLADVNTTGNNTWNTTKTLGTNIINGLYLGGNYWSNYTGSDGDNDGLGETNYTISSGNVDLLPLVAVKPPEDFTATAASSSSINIAWTKGSKVNTTYIRYKQGSIAPVDLTD